MWNEQEWLNSERSPARSVGRSHPGYHTVYFPSQKNHGYVLCEGALEAAYCLWLEWDVDVTAFSAQPHTFHWKANGRSFRYTPDFFVQHRELDNHFTEVKYDFERLTQRHRQKMASFCEHCQALHITLRLADREQLLVPGFFTNLRYLYFRSLGSTQREDDYLVDYLKRCDKKMTIRNILSSPYPPTARAICKRLFRGELQVDLKAPLTLDTEIISSNAPSTLDNAPPWGQSHEH